MSPEQITEYAASLFDRCQEGVILSRAEVAMGDWKPQAKLCHENVTAWCESNARYEPSRGWLYFDLGGLLDHVLFIAHSAVRAPDGRLYDITPTDASRQYPFIPPN